MTGTAAPLRTSAESRSGRDEQFLRLAIALGRRNLGRTWPNPSVGAVVVREDGGEPVIVAQAVTAPGGRPHAEPLALAKAGKAASGATLYVSLEPCSHHGRTPPCVDAIIAAQVARVVTALEDPDPRVAGRGHALLRDAGIEVTAGLLAGEAGRAHRGYLARIANDRPFVTLKLARTADGYAGRLAGPRLLVSGEGANRRVHGMRAHSDAILVGIGTVLADDPLLTVRLPGLLDRSPVRVVVDPTLRTPPGARLVATAREVPTWLVCNADAPATAEARLSEAGARVLRVGGAGPRADIAAVLRLLGAEGLTSVFSEGGPRIAEALAAADLIDEVVLVTSPNALAGEGVPALGPRLAEALADRFRPVRRESVGPDRIAWHERSA